MSGGVDNINVSFMASPQYQSLQEIRYFNQKKALTSLTLTILLKLAERAIDVLHTFGVL